MPTEIPPPITAQTGIMFGDGRIGAEFPTVERIDREHPASFSLYDSPRELFADWLVIAHDTRGHGYDEDQRATDLTNLQAIKDELVFACDEPDTEIVDVKSRSHFVSGAWHDDVTGVEEARKAGVAMLGELLCIAPCPQSEEERAKGHSTDGRDDCAYCENLETMISLQKRLADYPFLDEEAHSALDFEAWCDYMGDALGEELAASELDEDTVAAFEDNPTEFGNVVGQTTGCTYYAGHLSANLHHYNGFSGEYGPDMLEVAARQVAWALMSAGGHRTWNTRDGYRRAWAALASYMIGAAPWFVEPIDQDTRVSLTYGVTLEVVVDTTDGTVHAVNMDAESVQLLGEEMHRYREPGVKVSKHREMLAEMIAEEGEWPAWPT